MELDFWRLYVLVSCCPPNEYSKTTGLFLRFPTEERVVRVNKGKITRENTFNRDHFEIEGNHESSQNKKTLFCVFLHICYQCFNP